MSRLHPLSKDQIGGALLTALGLAAMLAGFDYRIGTLSRMGSGFVPVVLGAAMVLVGVAMVWTATPRRPGPTARATPLTGEAGPQWRGWSCILGGVAAFIGLCAWAGLIPGIFGCVFVAALGDRNNTLKDAALLALAMTVAGVLIFGLGLHVQLPLLQGW